MSRVLILIVFINVSIALGAYGQDRVLIPGRSSDLFFHTKLNRTLLINGAFTPGPWHTKYIELWQWNNNQWKLLSDSGPEVRNLYSYAYDQKRNVLVVYGGVNVPERNNRKNYADTWEWDGKNWKQIETTTNPGKRSAAKMVYDPVRKACVLFGGNNEKIELLGDTWTYDGKEWKQVYTDGPSARSPAAMFYFPPTNKIYLYGGHAPRSLQDRGNSSDTWELGDSGWKKLDLTVNPGIRAQTEITYNAATRTAWMIGGSATIQETTWTFDGNEWKQLTISGLPSRSGHGLTYDPKTKTIIAQGGVNIPGGPRLRDTWILKTAKTEWTCVNGCIDEMDEWMKEYPGDGDMFLIMVSTLYALDMNTRAEEQVINTVNAGMMTRAVYRRLGAYLLSIKKYSTAISCYQKSLDMEANGDDFYNLACAYALTQNKDKAFEALFKAVEHGVEDKQQFEEDTDLELLKKDRRWGELMKRL